MSRRIRRNHQPVFKAKVAVWSKIHPTFRYLKNASVSIQINLKKGQTVLIIMIRNQDYTKYGTGNV